MKMRIELEPWKRFDDRIDGTHFSATVGFERGFNTVPHALEPDQLTCHEGMVARVDCWWQWATYLSASVLLLSSRFYRAANK